MYLPPKFALSPERIDSVLADAGFAQLVSYSPTGLVVTPLPLLYDAERHALLGHVARANDHWRAAGAESVAIFTGPHAYVSPGFYPTKSETGKVVPTWNYEVLNVYGTLRVHDDAEWVLDLVTRLTDRHESGRAQPWRVSDAPASYTRAQLNGIVGVELPVDRVEAKAKMSQNQPARNRVGVIAGLAASGSALDVEVSERVAALDPDS
ncbi:FMN-binding negative transcriptional regulator [Mycolicibacterium goodii]|uniref:FMN-binding negative transcriptional regulator n=1 Tax=Mycolicibacterium goodii TaxID=134601 RepID=A0ABS6HU17_MYCGD|nr:FMN-binding negative transcriptional regulator [Mycolicibacterium goodii]OKH70156.1 transcriptional regulator [Mycobacterium sp. SWH-M5]MBU8825708.1 FMN-binding negative transcriptional regulator [Mycolicibacterium goodii]MBU8829879.1 FMN-binding negative transcriptional regulator [Mycolicibacterium goodii]MBU8839939.1 FMN-binding negative transcriptional regulator [Mycolicibacterium goodii]PJK20989.1 FMN-binding negative transcriptional regulator [Mycolicibacterium goodii]